MFSFIYSKTKVILIIIFILIQVLGIYYINRANDRRRDDLFLKATTPLAISINNIDINWYNPPLGYIKEINNLLKEIVKSSEIITHVFLVSNKSIINNQYIYSSDSSINISDMVYYHLKQNGSQIVNQNLVYHKIDNGYVLLYHRNFKFKSLEDIDFISISFLIFTLSGILLCLIFIFKQSNKGKPIFILSIFLLNISLLTLYGFDNFLNGRLNILDNLTINGELITNLINESVKKEVIFSNEITPFNKFKFQRDLPFTVVTKLPILVNRSQIIKPIFEDKNLIGFKESKIRWNSKNSSIPEQHAKNLSLEISINNDLVLEFHTQHKHEPYFVDIPIYVYGNILNFRFYSTQENINRNVIINTLLLMILTISLVIIVFILTIIISSKHIGLKTLIEGFMSSASEGFSTWDLNYNLTYINKAQVNILKQLGFKLPILGVNLLHYAPKLKTDTKFVNFLNNKKISGYKIECFKVIYNSKIAFFSINAFRISNGIGLIVSDITETISKEEKLKEMAAKANASNKVKTEFLSNISHELRTPLNGISGLSDILLESPLPKEEKNYIKAIKECGDRLIKIVNDILDFSKYQSDDLKILEEPLYLKKIFNNLFINFQDELSRKELNFEIDIDHNIPSELIGDRSKIKQILLNIVENAIKFTTNGKISCSVNIINQSKSKIDLMFSIKDTGIGIPGNKLEDIFEMFYQVDSSLTREYPGTGLGLSTSKKLINHLGGDIGVESTLGKGSNVWFTLSLEHISDDVQLITKKALKILVVDDNKVNIMVAENILKKLGHNVYSTINGKEAIESVRDNNFDLVFMDIQMPVMDGIEATIAIRNGLSGNKKKEIPIAAMTANTSHEIAEKYIQSGMNGIVTKPISASSISSFLKEFF